MFKVGNRVRVRCFHKVAEELWGATGFIIDPLPMPGRCRYTIELIPALNPEPEHDDRDIRWFPEECIELEKVEPLPLPG
jgi:hypothetical protein